MNPKSPSKLSRRSLLKAGATVGVALCAPGVLRAQGLRVRKNIMSADAASDIASYRDAVAAMLRLPADDPCNWYRIAFIHLLDCPHGNWWFTSWHRGYLGYFEELCREMSGNPDFMLPYWDWTADPYLPAALFGADNPLDPVNYVPDRGPGYIPDFATFESQTRGPMETYWGAMTQAQRTEQSKRMNPDFETFWSDPSNGALAAFQAQPHARYLTAANAQLDVNAQPLVAIERVRKDLAPVAFAGTGVTFENPVTSTHQGYAGFSLLSGTHNIVHMSTGGSFVALTGGYAPPYGLMSQNLSPADPIFFLHHGNIDRLWDVWTRKQIARGLPTGPADDLLASYKPEPYLFFVDAKGQAVTESTTAWDYFETGRFDYTYEPGSGEDVVQAPVARLSMQGGVGTANVMAMGSGTADFVAPDALVASAEQPSETSVQFAQVTFVPPEDALGKVFLLFVSPQGQPADLDPDGPHFAGRFTFFGHPHHPEMPVSFTVPIDEVLDGLLADGTLASGAPLSFTLVAAGGDMPLTAGVAAAGTLRSVDVQVISSQ